MELPGQQETVKQNEHQPLARPEIIRAVVSYLPSPNTFRHEFAEKATVGAVQIDAMAFFGVTDHRDRDIHEFFLEFEGRRLTDRAETLEHLLGPHKHEAHFHLIEQITKGNYWRQ